MKDRLVLAVAASLVIGAGFAASAQEPSMSPTLPGPEEVIVASPSPADVLRGTWDERASAARAAIEAL